MNPRDPLQRAVVAYPGVMSSAGEVARAFAERGMLERFETTFAYRPDRALDKAVVTVMERVLGTRAAREVGRRSIPPLAGAQIRRNPVWDGLRVLASRLGAGDVIADRLWERMILAFDEGVAKRLHPGIGLVYGYEHSCRSTFERARELGVPTVFDLAAPHYSYSQRVMAEQIRLFPENATDHWRATQPLKETRNARKQAELEMADLVIANSRFTAQSLLDTGFPPERIRVVPRAAPPTDTGWREYAEPGTRRLLYAGSVSTGKGAHLLLDAWRSLRGSHDAELILAGSWLLPDRMRAALPAGVRAIGNVPRSLLYGHYARASALVFPSLFDGFGLVVSEALAHGLPVITTDRVGAADLIEDGRSGWVLPAGDVEALASRMQWCLDHPGDLYAMREAAQAAAERRPWSLFRTELVDTIGDFFRNEPKSWNASASAS